MNDQQARSNPVASVVNYLKRCDGNHVVCRGDQPIHAPIPFNLRAGYAQKLVVFRVLIRSGLGGKEFATFRRNGRNTCAGKG